MSQPRRAIALLVSGLVVSRAGAACHSFTEEAGTDGGADGSTADSSPDAEIDSAATDGGPCLPASESDPERCGAVGTCGKSCAGGGCSNGRCTPGTLLVVGGAGPAVNPLSLVVRGERLFFGDSSGSVHRCDRHDCKGSFVTIAKTRPAGADGGSGYSVASEVFSIVADETYVYWAQYYVPGDNLFRAKHDGSELVRRAANGSLAAMAVENGVLYWSNFGAGTSSLWRCTVASCFGGQAATFMSNPYVSSTPPDPADCSEIGNRCWYATSLTLNGDEVTVVDGKSPPYATLLSIRKDAIDAAVAPSPHGASYPFAFPTSVAAWKGSLYVSQAGPKDDSGQQVAGRVFRISPASVPVDLALDEGSPESIATDGVDVYWVAAAAGEVRKCGIGGCGRKPSVVAAAQGGPTSLVATDDALYWANSLTGELKVLVK